MRKRPVSLTSALLVLIAFSLTSPAHSSHADEGWDIAAFDVIYVINSGGTVDVIEDIRVDFLNLEKHGIFRDMPVEYAYDDENNRLISVTNIHVDDGRSPHEFEVIEDGPNLRIKIGDPDVLVTGPQRYRIRYTISGALNPFPDHDEFYWNVTGADSVVPIDRATARVITPGVGIQEVTCFEGPLWSTSPCAFSLAEGAEARFSSGTLPEGSNLTIVLALDKGLVAVGPPVLVDANESVGERVSDFLGLHPLAIGGAVVLGFGLLAAVVRQWWIAGRDRWYGDMSHADANPNAARKPLFAHETIVTEFTPPEIARRRRRLRPAEIGLLVDERADTLDVTATIVDLAVRGYLSIEETEEGGVFGLFKKNDYVLHRGKSRHQEHANDDSLLAYEKRLLKGLLGDREETKLSDLKTHFHEHLAKVKEQLAGDMTRSLRYFPRSPEETRRIYRWAGAILAGIGVALFVLLGQIGVALLALPVALAGGLLFFMAPLMPSRTADGRAMYRRCLGFRRYIEKAETERQAFAERANLFEEYLPYAIIFECVDKWANAFKGLGGQDRQPSWYRGRGPFVAAAFASSVNDFSQSISSVMASTPGGRGGSGFGGGGFSGGGGGGGGVGSW